MMSFEEISFRNLVEFYQKELKNINKRPYKLTENRRISLLEKGVICISRIGRPKEGSRYELTPQTRDVLKEIELNDDEGGKR